MSDRETEPMQKSAVPPTAPILGLPVHLLDDYSAWVQDRLERGLGTHVVTLNAEMAVMADRDRTLAAAIEQADLAIPDGAGVVLALRWRSGVRVARCPGIELAAAAIASIGSRGENWPVFFYGGSPGRARSAATFWQQRYPSLTVETEHGYLSADGERQLCQTLADRQPRLILVGLGVPRQEFWIQAHRSLCPNAIWIGVGGSFDIWAGTKIRAPRWFRDNNLEWLYRLYQEPQRWRRMLALPVFAWRTLWR